MCPHPGHAFGHSQILSIEELIELRFTGADEICHIVHKFTVNLTALPFSWMGRKLRSAQEHASSHMANA